MPYIIEVPTTIPADRLDHAIAVMQEVVSKKYRFSLESWYDHAPLELKEVLARAGSLNEVHACGTTACVLGWIATTPEFKQAGGEVELRSWGGGYITFEGKDGLEAGGAWMQDPFARLLFYPGSIELEEEYERIEAMLPDHLKDVTLLASAYRLNSETVEDNDQYDNITSQEALDALMHIKETGKIKIMVDEEGN